MVHAARQLLQAWLDERRRTGHERCGSDLFSRPALHELDRKLEKFLDFDGGFFVEAGANDGFAQSNTYYFERFRRWRECSSRRIRGFTPGTAVPSTRC